MPDGLLNASSARCTSSSRMSSKFWNLGSGLLGVSTLSLPAIPIRQPPSTSVVVHCPARSSESGLSRLQDWRDFGTPGFHRCAPRAPAPVDAPGARTRSVGTGRPDKPSTGHRPQTLQCVRYPRPRSCSLPRISSAVAAGPHGWWLDWPNSVISCLVWVMAHRSTRASMWAECSPRRTKWSSYCSSIRSPAMPSRSIQARRSSHALPGVGGDAGVAVLAPPGGDELPAVPEPAAHRRLAGVVVGGVDVLGGGRHRLLHGNVDVLPLAGHGAVVQRQQDGDVGAVRRGVIRLRTPQLRRRRVRPARDVHVPAHGKAHQVRRLVIAVRPGLSERRDGRVHQPGRIRRQTVVSQTQRVHVPRRPVSSSTSEARASLRSAAAPSAVPMSSVTLRLLVLKCSQYRLRPGPGCPSMNGPNLPHRIAARRLDLDHVGAHVGHQLAAVNAHGAGQVQ